jgi:mRNA interferase MazF
VGALVVARGEVWWGEAPEEKGRPFLVVSRDAANAVMGRVLVAPVTRRVRGVPSELALGSDEGLPISSVASFDNVRPFPKAMLVRRLGALGHDRRHELCAVAAATLDC